MPRRPLLSLITLALAAAALPAAAAEPPGNIAKLAWLAGCWKSSDGEPGSMEQWMPLAGGTMLGASRTVKQGRTSAFEFMQVREQADGTVVFHAMPAGQPPESFPAVKVAEREAVFENLKHDFPQRIVYSLDGASTLNARIEGMRNGQLKVIPFPMTRVSCDGLLQGIARQP